MAYLKRFTGKGESENASDVPQSQRLPGQVANSAGGFSFEVCPLTRLRRFLILGSEGGNYYQNEAALTRENAENVEKLVMKDEESAMRVLELAVSCSVEGRAAKQDPAIFVLAMCARLGCTNVRKAAYEAVPKVCRIPTTLFTFITFCEAMNPNSTGWGRLPRKAIASWYTEKEALRLAQLVTKYNNRGGWCHRDVLRLCHPSTNDAATSAVFKYIIKGLEEAEKSAMGEDGAMDEKVAKVIDFLRAVQEVKEMKEVNDETVAHLCRYIQSHGIVREHIPTGFLNTLEVWSALNLKMPITALVRNLAKMTSIGLLDNIQEVEKVCSTLRNKDILEKGRMHPFTLLVAKQTYARGRGLKGSLTWKPNPQILQALEDAFYSSFKFVTPSGKRFVLALDVSGSMDCACMGSPVVTCALAAACMSMVTLRTEEHCRVVGFSHRLVDVPITKTSKLADVTRIVNNIPMGGTDCAAPMMWAIDNNVEADVFVVYTDCETWFGQIHPHKALQKYRAKTGIPARLIVVGMSANRFTIADPNDAGMLDIAGFDSAAPEVMRQFAVGDL